MLHEDSGLHLFSFQISVLGSLSERHSATPIMSDDDDGEYCDWCGKETKRRSLVMGYTDRCSEDFLWGKGDCICAKCLKDVKKMLYQVKYRGRNMYATGAYWDKYWADDPRAVLVKEPEEPEEPGPPAR